MCGIIGYTGKKAAVPILLEGLSSLEYRGYDSAGIALQKNGLKKMIYQTAWKENGVVAGLVEISMVIPEDMPHYIR